MEETDGCHKTAIAAIRPGAWFELTRNGEGGHDGQLDFMYPSMDTPTYLRVDLIHVRASDGIRIHYDFKRDGWAIEQPACLGPWDSAAEVDEKWTEVAFVASWALTDPDNNEAK